MGYTGYGTTRMRCHSEEPQPVLSIAKEESRIVHEDTLEEILRFAQNDSREASSATCKALPFPHWL